MLILTVDNADVGHQIREVYSEYKNQFPSVIQWIRNPSSAFNLMPASSKLLAVSLHRHYGRNSHILSYLKPPELTDISLGNLPCQEVFQMIQKSAEAGNWLVLKNLHLTPQLIPLVVAFFDQLNSKTHRVENNSEFLSISLSESSIRVHKEFRLFLSSEQSADLTPTFLETCSKVVLESVKTFEDHVVSNVSLLSSLKPHQTLSLDMVELRNQLALVHSIFAMRNEYKTFKSECEFNDRDLLVAKQLLSSNLDLAQVTELMKVFLYSSKLEVEEDMTQVDHFLAKVREFCGFDVRRNEQVASNILQKVGADFWAVCEVSPELREKRAEAQLRQIRLVLKTLV